MDPQPTDNLPFSAAEWEQLRIRFRDSLMLNTELFKLAQNIDATWPIRGKDETPSKYISFSLDELRILPEFYGKPDRLPLLYQILAETLAFDDPFGEMADYVDSSSRKDDSALKALRKLEIPEDFPVQLANFSEDTKAFCKAEEIRSLADLIAFSQNMAQSIVVGGEFRSFLNSLTHLDTQTLKRFVPIRDGKSGLFLAEFIGHLAANCEPAEAATLLDFYGLKVNRREWSAAKPLNPAQRDLLFSELQRLMQPRFECLPDQAQQLRHAAQSGETALLRFFAPLADPDSEALAQAIALAALDFKPKSKGLLGRLFKH